MLLILQILANTLCCPSVLCPKGPSQFISEPGCENFSKHTTTLPFSSKSLFWIFSDAPGTDRNFSDETQFSAWESHRKPDYPSRPAPPITGKPIRTLSLPWGMQKGILSGVSILPLDFQTLFTGQGLTWALLIQSAFLNYYNQICVNSPNTFSFLLNSSGIQGKVWQGLYSWQR